MRLKHWSRDLCAISNCHGLSCLPFHSLQRFEHLILCWFCIQQNLDCCKAIQYHVQWHTVAPMTWLCPTSPQHTQPSWFWFHTWAFCTDTVEIRSRWQSANLELHNFIRITKTNTLSVCCSPCSNPNRNPRAYAGVSCSSASCCDKQHASSHFFWPASARPSTEVCWKTHSWRKVWTSGFERCCWHARMCWGALVPVCAACEALRWNRNASCSASVRLSGTPCEKQKHFWQIFLVCRPIHCYLPSV